MMAGMGERKRDAKIVASLLSNEMVHGEVDDGRPDLPYHMMDKVPHPIEAKYHQSMDQKSRLM